MRGPLICLKVPAAWREGCCQQPWQRPWNLRKLEQNKASVCDCSDLIEVHACSDGACLRLCTQSKNLSCLAELNGTKLV